MGEEMKGKGRGRPGAVPNELLIRATPDIRVEDIAIGDRVSYIHPSGGGQHIGTVTEITSRGIIRTKDWVEDKLNIVIANVREIWKLEGEVWVRQPLYREDKE